MKARAGRLAGPVPKRPPCKQLVVSHIKQCDDFFEFDFSCFFFHRPTTGMDAESGHGATETDVLPSSVGTNLQQEVIHEGEVTNSTSSSASRRLSIARHRKKSRRLTLTQVCAEEASQSGESGGCQEMPSGADDAMRPGAVNLLNEMAPPVSEPSGGATRRGSRLSFSLASPERKMSKIFTMLQSMQQIFLQASLQPPTPPCSPGGQQMAPPAPAACHSPAVRVNSVQPSRVGKQTMLYGMGRSQDSLVVPNRLRNPVLDRLNRFGSINSWAGSECSEASSACSGPPPPLVHAVPYHKDGWCVCFFFFSFLFFCLFWFVLGIRC